MAKAARPDRALEQLEQQKFEFGKGTESRKLAALDALRDAELNTSEKVTRLHDLLCFMMAYPDSRKLRGSVQRMLEAFEQRADLDYFRDELANSGIAGTEVHFPFFWFTLCRLVALWPDKIRMDWAAFKGKQLQLLDRRLSMLMPYCETLALEEAAQTTREWVETLKGADETDASFIVRRFQAMRAEPRQRESIFEEMDIPFIFEPGPDTPSATRNHHAPSPVKYQNRPLVRSRETFWKELDRPPVKPRSVSRGEARDLMGMALTLMVTRTRDLDCFVHAKEDDVSIVDYPEGFQLVCFGSKPERRQMLDAAYGFLMLRNGALIGYVLSASLFESAEAAYNVSPPFRGAEATHLYARCLHAVRHMFGAETFMVDPYQMGHENLEGLRSGAWWFYYKLGFRPRDPQIARMAEAEQKKAAETRGFRSTLAKLNRLSSVNMYLHLGEPRDDVIGDFSREAVGLQIVRYLSDRFGADREKGIERCSAEVAELTGLRRRELSDDERRALSRWAPLVSVLPEVAGWSSGDRKKLGDVIRAKGGRRESDFVRRFDRHRRLRQAIFDLSRAE